MKLELNTGICPIIDVGLYQSRLSAEEMFDGDDQEILRSDEISEEDMKEWKERNETS